jgi:hypothetical protein
MMWLRNTIYANISEHSRQCLKIFFMVQLFSLLICLKMYICNVHLETESMFLIRAANTGTASVLIIANL